MNIEQTVSAENFINLAEELFAENNFELAAKYFLNSILVQRVNPLAYKGLGKTYANLKKYDKGIEALKKAKENLNYDAEIYSHLGVCYMGKGNFCFAARNFIKAIQLDPQNTDYQIQLAICHEIMGEDEMAISIYDRIISVAPQCFKAYIEEAALLMKLELFAEAADVFCNLLKVNKKYYKAYLGLAICFDKIGDSSLAQRYYKKYAKLMSSSSNCRDVLNRILEIRKEKPSKENFLKVV